jgi:hypothetical protein
MSSLFFNLWNRAIPAIGQMGIILQTLTVLKVFSFVKPH